jgi:hypothetical protein
LPIRRKACRPIFTEIEQASIRACLCIIGFHGGHQVQALLAPGGVYLFHEAHLLVCEDWHGEVFLYTSVGWLNESIAYSAGGILLV